MIIWRTEDHKNQQLPRPKGTASLDSYNYWQTVFPSSQPEHRTAAALERIATAFERIAVVLERKPRAKRRKRA